MIVQLDRALSLVTLGLACFCAALLDGGAAAAPSRIQPAFLYPYHITVTGYDDSNATSTDPYPGNAGTIDVVVRWMTAFKHVPIEVEPTGHGLILRIASSRQIKGVVRSSLTYSETRPRFGGPCNKGLVLSPETEVMAFVVNGGTRLSFNSYLRNTNASFALEKEAEAALRTSCPKGVNETIPSGIDRFEPTNSAGTTWRQNGALLDVAFDTTRGGSALSALRRGRSFALSGSTKVTQMPDSTDSEVTQTRVTVRFTRG